MLETRAFSSVRRRVLVLSSLAHFTNDGFGVILPSVFPLMISLFGLAPTELGIIAALFNFIPVVASPLIGYISDRVRRYSLLIGVGLFLMSTGVLGYSLSSFFANGIGLYYLFLFFSVVGGFGFSFYHPIGGSALTSVYTDGGRGRALGINGAMGSLGRALYPSIIVLLVSFSNLPSALAILSAIGFLSAFAVISLMMNKRSERDEQNKSRKTTRKWTRQALQATTILTIISALRAVFSQGVTTFLAVYLIHVQHYSFEIGVGVIIVIMMMAGVVGQPAFGYLMDVMGRRLALVFNTLGSSITLLVYLLTQDIVVGIIVIAIFGFFTFSQFPLYIGLTSDYVPQEVSSMANSMVWGVGNFGGSALGPLIVGLLSGNSFGSLTVSFMILAMIGGASAILTPLLPRRLTPQFAHLKPSAR